MSRKRRTVRTEETDWARDRRTSARAVDVEMLGEKVGCDDTCAAVVVVGVVVTLVVVVSVVVVLGASVVWKVTVKCSWHFLDITPYILHVLRFHHKLKPVVRYQFFCFADALSPCRNQCATEGVINYRYKLC